MSQQLFVGRLPRGCKNRDLEDIFYKYGKMTRCDVKTGLKMSYGFVEYEDRRDAEDAIHHEHGRDFMGARIVVEWARGAKGEGGDHRRDRDGDRDRYRRDDRRRSRSRERYSRKRSRSRSRDRDRRRSRDRDADRRRSRSRSHDRDADNRRSRSRSRDRDNKRHSRSVSR